MSKVEVLCPNGHRVNVKITPNTKLLLVLEEVCTKQGFSPSADYELRHGRKTLDLTLSVQFAGIPNLAKLDLVKANKSRADAPVTIALQTVEGERLTREFLPSVSLYDILDSFEQDDGRGGKAKLLHSRQHNVYPICQYLKDEVIGEHALRETSLRQLGLTSGRAIIRHFFKEISQADIASINAHIDAEKARKEKLAAVAATKLDSAVSPTSGSANVIEPKISPSPTVPSNVIESTAQQKTSHSISKDERNSDSFKREQESHDIQPMDFLPSNAFSSPPSRSRGFQTPAQRMAVTQPFSDFKFPEETKGKDLYKNDLSEFNKEEHQPCDREVVIYHIHQHDESSEMQVDEPPDDFFDVTESDVRLIYSDLKRKAEDDQPLLTEGMRKAALEAKFGQYLRAIIRFHLPDGLIIQAVFRPRETVFALTKFVKEYLFDKNLAFELYTTPPKCTLKDKTATLIEASLVPLTNVYIGVDHKSEQYLSHEAVCTISNKEAADIVVARLMPRVESRGKNSESKSVSAVLRAATGGSRVPDNTARCDYSSSSGNSASGNTADSNSGKVPKWFKPGK